MKYRKKPVVIEAVQFTGGNADDILRFAGDDAVAASGTSVTAGPGGTLEVETMEGTMRLNSGAWLIRGVKGELYPCADDVFRQTYDAADLIP